MSDIPSAVKKNTNYQAVLTKLHCLVTGVDSWPVDTEKSTLAYLIKIEGIDKKIIIKEISKFMSLKSRFVNLLECLSDLELLKPTEKIRCLAWIIVIEGLAPQIVDTERYSISRLCMDLLKINHADVDSCRSNILSTIECMRGANKSN